MKKIRVERQKDRKTERAERQTEVNRVRQK